MLKTFALIGLGAAISLAPLSGLAQTTPAPAPSASSAAPAHHVRHYTGSYRSEMRKRHTASHERARASAEHMRKMHNP